MKRPAFIACLPLLVTLTAGCQSEEALPAGYVATSARDFEIAATMRHINDMSLEMMRHSNRMAELEPPAPPEFYLAMGAYYHVHKKWPTDAAQLKEFGWTGSVPVTITPQPHIGVDVTIGDQVKRTHTLYPPEARRTGLINREEAAMP